MREKTTQDNKEREGRKIKELQNLNRRFYDKDLSYSQTANIYHKREELKRRVNKKEIKYR